MKLRLPIILGLPWLLACGNPETSSSPAEQKECMARVIAIDDSLGKIRNHACERISLNETIDNYVTKVESINFQACPSDFSSSFKNHCRAWINAKEITGKYATLRGEMHDLFRQIESGKDSIEFKRLQKDIWDTWAAIEKAMK